MALPSPEEDHNPATSGDLASVLAGRPDIPYEQRAQVARFLGDISASSTGGWYSVISLHGGGSPQAMKREIYRRYPIEERRSLVERLLDRGVAETGSSGAPNRQKQPGQCCATGCQPPSAVSDT